MEIYLLLAVLSLSWHIISYLGKDTAFAKKAYLIVIFGILTLVAGLRAPTVGTDTPSYTRHFARIAATPWGELTSHNMDFGFTLLNKLISLFTGNAQIMIFVVSLITLAGFAVFIYKNSDNIGTSVFLFITLYQFCFFLNIMRQFLAIMLICNAYYFLKKNKLIPFFALMIGAFFSHAAAILFLPIMLFTFVKPRNIWIGIIVGVGLCALLFFKPLLSIFFRALPQYSWYQDAPEYLQPKGFDENIVIWVAQAGLVIAALYIIRIKEKLSLPEQEVRELYLLAAIVTISIVLNLLTVRVMIILRLNFYFYVFMIILIPKVLKYMGKHSRWLHPAMIVCLLAYFFVMLRNNNHEVVPYQFVFGQ